MLAYWCVTLVLLRSNRFAQDTPTFLLLCRRFACGIPLCSACPGRASRGHAKESAEGVPELL